jgi:hypothetical protein
MLKYSFHGMNLKYIRAYVNTKNSTKYVAKYVYDQVC